jgi:hypothetical protein
MGCLSAAVSQDSRSHACQWVRAAARRQWLTGSGGQRRDTAHRHGHPGRARVQGREQGRATAAQGRACRNTADLRHNQFSCGELQVVAEATGRHVSLLTAAVTYKVWPLSSTLHALSPRCLVDSGFRNVMRENRPIWPLLGGRHEKAMCTRPWYGRWVESAGPGAAGCSREATPFSGDRLYSMPVGSWEPSCRCVCVCGGGGRGSQEYIPL